jgi:hypothetical protein
MIHGRRAGQTVLVLTAPSSASEVLLYDCQVNSAVRPMTHGGLFTYPRHFLLDAI